MSDEGFVEDRFTAANCAQVFPKATTYSIPVTTPDSAALYTLATADPITWSFANGNAAVRFLEFEVKIKQVSNSKEIHVECVVESLWEMKIRSKKTYGGPDGGCYLSLEFYDSNDAVFPPGEVSPIARVRFNCLEKGDKYRSIDDDLIAGNTVDMS